MRRATAAPLRRLLRFDEPPAEYELLENEQGEPPFFGGWRSGARQTARRESAVPPVSAQLEENLRRLSGEYRRDITTDLILRRFSLGGRVRAAVAFFDGMADAARINDFILRPAMRRGALSGAGDAPLAQFVLEHVLAMQDASLTADWEEVRTAVSEGRCALLVDGDAQAIVMDTRGFPGRTVTEPRNETVILGPHEAFTENIRTNISLLRKIIRTDDFVCEFRHAGAANNVRLAVAYREGVANRTLVNEVKRRLARVDTLKIISIGMLVQLIEEHPYSPVSQSLITERPDRTASALMDGHVAILVEGSPQACVMPVTFFMLMTSAEDAYLRPVAVSIIRLVRYLGAFFSTILPAYFVALALHHQGMLSEEILATIASSRHMVFLPLALEMIFLQLVFQLVREASLSAPGPMGQSVGIIGGLILGQAAVAANIVSTVVLIIVAISGLGNFTIPDYRMQNAISYFRILLVLSGWLGGLLGLMYALLLSAAYLASLKSCGVPFLTPVSPKTMSREPQVLRKRRRNERGTLDYTNAGGLRT